MCCVCGRLSNQRQMSCCFTRKCSDIVQVRLASLQFSDVKFPLHRKLLKSVHFSLSYSKYNGAVFLRHNVYIFFCFLTCSKWFFSWRNNRDPQVLCTAVRGFLMFIVLQKMCRTKRIYAAVKWQHKSYGMKKTKSSLCGYENNPLNVPCTIVLLSSTVYVCVDALMQNKVANQIV